MGKSHKQLGIESKRPAELFYLADVLADQNLNMISNTAYGIWTKALFNMLRNRVDRITGNMDQLIRLFGSNPKELEEAIKEFRGSDVCRVTQRHGVVTLICRRQERKLAQEREEAEEEAQKQKEAEERAKKDREQAAERKRRERLNKKKGDSHAGVTACHGDFDASSSSPTGSHAVSASLPGTISPPLAPKRDASPEGAASEAALKAAGTEENGLSDLGEASQAYWNPADMLCFVNACPKAWREQLNKRAEAMMAYPPAIVLATVFDVSEGKQRPKDIDQAMNRIFWRLKNKKAPNDDHYDRAKRILAAASRKEGAA